MKRVFRITLEFNATNRLWAPFDSLVPLARWLEDKVVSAIMHPHGANTAPEYETFGALAPHVVKAEEVEVSE